MDRKKPMEIEANHDHRINVWTLVKDQEGEPMTETIPYAVKMVQVVGEFAGASLQVMGEIIPGELDVLTDYDGIELSFWSRGIKSTDDRCSKVMPKVIGGSDLTNLRVGIMLTRT